MELETSLMGISRSPVPVLGSLVPSFTVFGRVAWRTHEPAGSGSVLRARETVWEPARGTQQYHLHKTQVVGFVCFLHCSEVSAAVEARGGSAASVAAGTATLLP